MTTATPDTVEITFTDEQHEDPCEALDNCSRASLWRVRFRWSCNCWPETVLYCEAHRQSLEQVHGFNRPCCITCQADASVASITPKGRR